MQYWIQGLPQTLGSTPFSPLQGRHASQDELAASAYQAVEVDQQFDGAPVQVRVSMGKEPRHFMAIFKGKLVIYEVRTYRQNYAGMIGATREAGIRVRVYMCRVNKA